MTAQIVSTLADALSEKGYDTLTPVQIAVSDPELGEADLLVSAQTGSGKTVGFGLAIAPTLLGDKDQFGYAGAPLALVIAPTRELAMQVKRELEWLYAKAGVRVASCVGGMDPREERRALGRGAHIVVATPGRLRDHIERSAVDMHALRAVVLDEADEMLDLGFSEDLEFILSHAPENRRTLMFSATVPKGIAQLAKTYQKPDAVRVTTQAEKKQHADIEYRALTVAPSDTENAIINVLRYYEAPSAIVFGNTRAMVARLTARLSNRGFSVVSLSGELSQNERTHALQAMRDGRARVCIATDVAARGIDLPNLELVIHADLPTNADTLLHRSGRTGRAGRKGVSTLIVPHRARGKAERLLKFARLEATWAPAPSADEVMAQDEARLLADPAWHEPVPEGAQPLVSKLAETFSAEQLAAAYVALYQSRHSAPEDLAPTEAATGPRDHKAFDDAIWFALSVGSKDQAEARWLLPMLCRMGGITRTDIGAIRVQDKQTFVQIAPASASGFLDSLGAKRELDGGIRVTQLDKAPDLPSERPRAAPWSKDGKKPFRKPGRPKPEGFKARKAKGGKPAPKHDGTKPHKPRKPRK
ncbi:ATP-dependent RNA helicase DeaD [Rubricella aquisinus]|uniref:ATP-dependent RNA helicase DeaD n=1 Tax=Rubricella aquisinus TaxID=2028108 RepID=A0A840WV69_9RHOB|nr:DEAD/DEAH box helicase [Rubricella aquisinus]MBB5514124.1 ATP-dependent RNA helicase DeaD [Rubricella aquisinus]